MADSRGKGHPSYNPRCPKCNATSGRMGKDLYRCRVRGCRVFFNAPDPDLSKVVMPGLDKAKMRDDAAATLIKGIPPDNPHCPECGGTSAKRPNSILRCRVRGCGHEFPDPREAPN